MQVALTTTALQTCQNESFFHPHHPQQKLHQFWCELCYGNIIRKRSLVLDSQLGLELSQLFAETRIGLAAGSLLLEQFEGVIEGPSILLHEVRNEQRGTSRNSCSAVHKHIPGPARIINPLIGGPEGVGGILGLAVVEVEFEVDEIFGVCEVKINPRAHCRDIVLLEFVKIVGEIVATDPNLPETSLALEHLLSLAVVGSE